MRDIASLRITSENGGLFDCDRYPTEEEEEEEGKVEKEEEVDADDVIFESFVEQDSDFFDLSADSIK